MARRQHRSHFHKTWTNETTPKPGFVYPILFKECLPGDTWKITIGEMLKTGAMLAPFFGRYQMRFAIFKEAYRNVWPNFDNARTGFAPNSNTPDNSVWPYMLMDANSCKVGSLADHLGVPALTFLTPDENGVLQPNSQVLKVAAAPFRVLAKIYNEWLMREHVQSELPLSLADGYDTTTNTQLYRIGWGHDRFTDALPDQQLGPQATLPIALEAPVVGTGKAMGWIDGTTEFGAVYSNGSTGQQISLQTTGVGIANGEVVSVGTSVANQKTVGLSTDATKSQVKADLSSAASVTVPQLLLSLKMQEVSSRLMLFGSRMTEWLAAFWGVKADDARFQRSQYIGGFSTDIFVTPVEQTSGTGISGSTTALGTLAGRGTSGAMKGGFTTHFKEDGFICVLMWMRPMTKYAQGLPRMFQRFSRMDMALPVFQHLPPQPIKNSELYAVGVTNGTSATDWDDESLQDNQTFAFEMMYDEYRRFYSEVHGEFLTSMSYWTTWKKFGNLPVFNHQFIECNPSDNMFAYPQGTNYQAQFLFSVDIWRKLAKRGTPRYGV